MSDDRFEHTTLEQASIEARRTWERVERILLGCNTSLVGTIAVNLMIEVMFSEVPDRDPEGIAYFISELINALHTGCANQIEREKRERRVQ